MWPRRLHPPGEIPLHRLKRAPALSEERRKANEARRQREADAEERWQEEYESRLRIWTASGGAESDFDQAWPEIRHKLLMERVAGDEGRRSRAAFSDFRM